jgi:hypothetical protein
MRKKGSDRYVWMTQSWLISLYLDCPPHMRLNCPSDQAKAAMIKALQAGDIVYHAYPFNAELEFMEESLLEFGFQVCAPIRSPCARIRSLCAILTDDACTGQPAGPRQ